jgi:hypothetical protein
LAKEAVPSNEPLNQPVKLPVLYEEVKVLNVAVETYPPAVEFNTAILAEKLAEEKKAHKLTVKSLSEYDKLMRNLAMKNISLSSNT